MGSGELWFSLTIVLSCDHRSPQPGCPPPTHQTLAPLGNTCGHSESWERHKKLVLKLFLIIIGFYQLRGIVDIKELFYWSILIDKIVIGSLDDGITPISEICYWGSHPNCVLSPMFLVQISDQWKQKVNLTLIGRGLSRTVLQWDKIILWADNLFRPPAPYFVKMMIMIFLVQAIDRCSASNSQVSWCECRNFVQKSFNMSGLNALRIQNICRAG